MNWSIAIQGDSKDWADYCAYYEILARHVSHWNRGVADALKFVCKWGYPLPGVAIVLTVLALNLLGDALNDAFNPRLRSR